MGSLKYLHHTRLTVPKNSESYLLVQSLKLIPKLVIEIKVPIAFVMTGFGTA